MSSRAKSALDALDALDALSAAEKAAVLDELLTDRPDLREPAETYAAAHLSTEDRSAFAGDVEDALLGWTSRSSTAGPDHSPAAGSSTRVRPPTRSWMRPCNRCSTSWPAALCSA